MDSKPETSSTQVEASLSSCDGSDTDSSLMQLTPISASFSAVTIATSAGTVQTESDHMPQSAPATASRRWSERDMPIDADESASPPTTQRRRLSASHSLPGWSEARSGAFQKGLPADNFGDKPSHKVIAARDGPPLWWPWTRDEVWFPFDNAPWFIPPTHVIVTDVGVIAKQDAFYWLSRGRHAWQKGWEAYTLRHVLDDIDPDGGMQPEELTVAAWRNIPAYLWWIPQGAPWDGRPVMGVACQPELAAQNDDGTRRVKKNSANNQSNRRAEHYHRGGKDKGKKAKKSGQAAATRELERRE